MVVILFKPKYGCVDSEDEDTDENTNVAKTKIVCGLCKYLICVIQCVHFILFLLFQFEIQGIGLYLENSQKSLIFLARQNKLLEVINSMTIIESEMMIHQQLFLSSQGI